jgi:hypothetical protein
MSDCERSKDGEHNTDIVDPKNINHSTSPEELPDMLHQKIQVKLNANLVAFLENRIKDQHIYYFL